MIQTLDEILSEIKNLEPLPQVAARVLALGAREEVIPRDLIAVIETDAAMTAKVLKLSNSAYYGFRRGIASITDAGNLLGVSALVNLVLTSCAAKYFRGHGAADERALQRMWEESVSNALAASLLARLSGTVDRNRAYTAGLLQNIGQVVLERHMQREEAQIERLVESGTARIAAERMVLGLDHAEVGARLCERWSFPEVLVDAVRFHHEPERATVDPVLACFVHLGEQVTMQAAREQDQLVREYALEGVALSRVGFEHDALAVIRGALVKEVEKAREFVETA
jgi:HD-like signal output (HDOD) protein